MSVWIGAVTRGHNGAACLLKDGELVFYLEEERLSRKKYDGGPMAGLLKMKEYTDKLDCLVVAHTDSLERAGKVDFAGDDYITALARKIGLIEKQGPSRPHPQVIDVGMIHHEMHASCAFYNSGFESAACLIVDGAGTFVPLGEDSIGWELETIFQASYPSNIVTKYKHIGVRGPVTTFEKIQVPHAHRGRGEDEGLHDVIFTDHPGITKTYEAMTDYLGFSFIEAGKAMGLAPYGKPNPEIPPIFMGPEGRRFSNRNLFVPNYPNGAYVDKTIFPYLDTDSLEVQKDFAYAVQEATSDEMIRLIHKAIELTGEKNIVIAGGYGLNCVANYKYRDHLPEGVNLYCEAIAHDGGTCIGAAKYIWHEHEKDMTIRKNESLYLGPQPSYDNIKLKEGEEIRDVTPEEVIDIIQEQNIVALYQGRSEAGPRALGNRSLLFDPTVKDGKDQVNTIKKREWFRPFAGTIMAEHVHDWFDLRGMDDTPFMMYAVNAASEEKAEQIPSIMHVDKTCRIQTVTEEQNANYYNLIKVFYERTGVPILFNTSFNLGGEPLVETVEDALWTLRNSGINYLYLAELGKLVTIMTNDREGKVPTVYG